MADTSPTLEKQRIVSLDVYSSIAENFKAIATSLVEYVKLRTGQDITPTVEAPKAEGITTTPTPEVTITQKKEKDQGLLGKLFGNIKKIFDPAKILAAFVAFGLIKNIFSGMWDNFKESFLEHISNIWETVKEKLSGIGEWFSNLFNKGGELFSNFLDSAPEFIQKFVDGASNFFSKIGDFISEKFTSLKEFFSGLNIFGKKPAAKKKEKPKEVKKEETLPTITKGIDEEGFAFTEKKAAKKVIKTEEQLQYEKERDAKLAERSKKSRERLRKAKEKKQQAITAPTPEVVTPTPTPEVVTPTPQPKAEQKITKPTQSISGMEDTKAMIIRHEGVRNKPYKDSLGLWTVGVGHLIGDGKSLPPEMNRTFSNEEVMAMFEEDFAHHKKIAEGTPGYSEANEPGKGAFIDLAFNMGKWWPKWPGTSKALNDGNFSLAAENMKDSKWYKQVGNRGVEIVNLVAQAGDGKGESIQTASNEVATGKRGLSKSDAPMVVNTPSTVNNTTITEEVNIQQKRNNTNSVANRVA